MSKAEQNNMLIYGYGNPGRQDDGLGVAFVEQIQNWLEQQNIAGVEVDTNYQLNIEDAYTISKKDVVVFVDASVEDIKDFCLTKVEPSEDVEFTMHAVSPSFVLDLSQKLYNSFPETYLLHIKGYEWEMKEDLTKGAKNNLMLALSFMKDKLQQPEILNQWTTNF